MIPADVRDAIWRLADEVPGDVYAIVDGARDDGLVPAVERSGLDQACLYAGELPPIVRRAAPHIVHLEHRSPLTVDLLAQKWGPWWGVFLISPARLADVRRHLRRLLKVRDEKGRVLLFRFYDPRVLRVYLPTCDGNELGALFGPVEEIVTDGDGVVPPERFRRTGRWLHSSALGAAGGPGRAPAPAG